MFTLLQGLWKYFFRKEEYYVVILGLDNAGKTVRPGSLHYFIVVLPLPPSLPPLFPSPSKRLYWRKPRECTLITTLECP